MLKSLRNGAKSTPMRAFLIVLAIGFALWGIDDVFRAVNSNDSAIEVGDTRVPAIDAAREFERARRGYMPNSSASEAIAAGLLQNVISGLAQQTLYIAEGERMGMTVTRGMVKESIASQPVFLDETGRFSNIRFRDVLARLNLSEEEYIELVRLGLMRTQLVNAVAAGLNYPEATADAIARWRLEQRVISHASIKVDPDAIEAPSAAEMDSWYAENKATFDSPDLRYLTVAVASPEAFLEQVELAEGELEQAYDDRIDEFRTLERRELEQMIFSSPDEAATALSRIKAGEGFAAVAEDMLGLSASDISLGILTRDDLTEEMATAAFSLAEPGLAGPVASPLGQHVLNITSIEPETVIALNDIRDGLAAELRREKATDLVYQRIADLEDALASGQTVEEAARDSGAMLLTINGMDRNGFDADGNAIDGLATDTNFRELVWTATPGETGLVEEGGADTFFVARVDREEAARSRPLNEVKDRVLAAMKLERAINSARTKAATIVVAENPAATAKASGITFSDDVTLRRDGVGFDHEAARLIAARAFEINTGDTSFIETGSEAVLIMVKSVEPARDDAAISEAAIYQTDLSGQLRQSADIAIARSLENKFDVMVNAGAVQRILIGAGN